MSQNDYIILRDEDGKAYIAHAGLLDNARNAIRGAANSISTTAQQVANKAKGVGRGVRQNHKYILKVFENGRTRYFYKPEEVKAYYEAKRKGIKNPAEYAQKAADAASNAVDAVKNVASKAGNAAKSAFREATGQAARDRMDTAAARRDTEAANMQANKQSRETSHSTLQSARQATREAEAERNRSEASLKGLKDKLKSDNEKALDVSSKAVDALTRKYAAESKARKASLDSSLSMPWEFQKRKDAKAVQADAWREGQQAEKERAELKDEYDRINKSRELTKKAYSTELAKSNEAWNQRAQALRNQDAAEKNYQDAQDKYNESRAAYREADSNYNKNKAAYDKSLAGAVDRTAARAKETASSAFSKAKDAANNTVSNAKSAYERMKDEFRDRAEQVADKAKDIAGVDERKERDRTRFEAEKPRADVYDEARANIAQREYDKTPLGMIDRARTAVKDKSEDLSAKAKSTAQSARDSVKGMIDNARSSTAKAVNEAWDRIPKKSDGTVNPFDKNFQSTYNDWKAKKDKYDSSLAGRAKDAAEKATDSVKDMIDQARKAVKGNSASKSTYGEYSDNDKDFAEKNYNQKNHVEDTDFYTFKRDDGKWVILEEDMKWVLPEGVTGNDPGIRNALKQFADHASSAKVIGNANYNNDQWVDAVTDAIDKAAERQSKKK